MKKFTLINKERSRIKVFEPFEDVYKNFQFLKNIKRVQITKSLITFLIKNLMDN